MKNAFYLYQNGVYRLFTFKKCFVKYVCTKFSFSFGLFRFKKLNVLLCSCKFSQFFNLRYLLCENLQLQSKTFNFFETKKTKSKENIFKNIVKISSWRKIKIPFSSRKVFAKRIEKYSLSSKEFACLLFRKKLTEIVDALTFISLT